MEDMNSFIEQESITLYQRFNTQMKLLRIIRSIVNTEYLDEGDYPIYITEEGDAYWLINERMVSTTFSERLVDKLYYLYHHDPPTGIAFINRLTHHRTNRSFKKNNRNGNEVFWLSTTEQKILKRLSKEW